MTIGKFQQKKKSGAYLISVSCIACLSNLTPYNTAQGSRQAIIPNRRVLLTSFEQLKCSSGLHKGRTTYRQEERRIAIFTIV